MRTLSTLLVLLEQVGRLGRSTMGRMLFITLICGCDGHSPPAMVGPNGLPPILENIVAARCERLLECPSGALKVFDAQTCQRAFGGKLCDTKLLKARPADADKCAAAIRALDCGLIDKTWWPPGCEAILNDLVGPESVAGESCGYDDECAIGLRCEGAREDCLGSCVEAHREGDACAWFEPCEGTSVCSTDSRCEQPRRPGERCMQEWDCEDECISHICTRSADLLGQVCSGTGAECGTTLRCTAGKCAPFAGPGEPCAVSNECYAGTGCVAGRCALAVQCGEGREGDPCADFRQCGEGLACSGATRRCTPAAQLGEGCSLDEVFCAEGLACASIDGGADAVCEVYEAPRPTGAQCKSFWDCESELCFSGECQEAMACKQKPVDASSPE